MAFTPKKRKKQKSLTPSRSKKPQVIRPHKETGKGQFLGGADNSTADADFLAEVAAKKPDHEDLTTVFEQCDYWGRESDFLKVYLSLKASIYNFGFRLRCKDTADNEKLKEWQDQICPPMVEEYTDPSTNTTIKLESQATNRERLCKFVEDVWNDWILKDNATIAWFDDSKFPLTLELTRCTYRDVFGAEILSYQHGISNTDAQMFEEKTKAALEEGTILFDANEGQHFKVMKRAPMGSGYGVPQLYSIFMRLTQSESMQYGLNAMAFAMQLVTRQHKLGHPIEAGDRAGNPTHFWTKRRGDATLKNYENRKGFMDLTTNFDHEVVYPWPDLKVFDDTAFKGLNEQLNRWGGPVAEMLRATGSGNPFLPNLIKADALWHRDKMRLFLGPVILSAFKLPVENVEIVWGNGIFAEARLQAEMLKHASLVGWTSVRTGREETGLDDADEKARKLEEAADKNARQVSGPMFDQSHGNYPALGDRIDAEAKAKAKASTKDNGRPTGAATA